MPRKTLKQITLMPKSGRMTLHYTSGAKETHSVDKRKIGKFVKSQKSGFRAMRALEKAPKGYGTPGRKSVIPKIRVRKGR